MKNQDENSELEENSKTETPLKTPQRQDPPVITTPVVIKPEIPKKKSSKKPSELLNKRTREDSTVNPAEYTSHSEYLNKLEASLDEYIDKIY